MSKTRSQSLLDTYFGHILSNINEILIFRAREQCKVKVQRIEQSLAARLELVHSAALHSAPLSSSLLHTSPFSPHA